MTKEFNLSDKRRFNKKIEMYEYPSSPYTYPEDDVKEFIKRLKIDMELTIENGNIIDKLAGEDLK